MFPWEEEEERVRRSKFRFRVSVGDEKADGAAVS